jgi:hypothetical protein
MERPVARVSHSHTPGCHSISGYIGKRVVGGSSLGAVIGGPMDHHNGCHQPCCDCCE